MKRLVLLALLSLVSLNATAQSSVFSDLKYCSQICSPSCLKYAQQVLDSAQQTVGDCSSQAPVDQQLFQEAYQYGYSGNGLNLTSAAAQAFANKIIALPNARVAFNAFKDAYAWGYSGNGLNLTSAAAQNFAWRIVRQPSPDQAFNCYKQDYTFAYSGSGMNMTSASAQAHAEQTCRLTP